MLRNYLILSVLRVISDFREFANVVAKPVAPSQSVLFATADDSGNYKLTIPVGAAYNLSVSYVGYLAATFFFEANSDIRRHDFKLAPAKNVLEEVVIKHEPIVVKKDTLIFDVRSFANGSEYKMKEILEKLPGVEVGSDGSVTVQGKRVTQMLVEGKSFFGGGSKLAVENIPADALDKIEVIDHFTETGFMKEVSDSPELAMNVRLREDKKNFMFGDLEAGVSHKEYYLAHAAVFYYRQKADMSFIGDANNAGKSTFTFEDMQRFESGSRYLTSRRSPLDLFSFTLENRDVAEMRAQFTALNFNVEASDKFAVSGFGLVSKIFTAERSQTFNQYLQNGLSAYENQTSWTDKKGLIGMGSIQLDFSRTQTEHWKYTAQFQAAANELVNTITSESAGDTLRFEALADASDVAFRHYLEWHRKHTEKHTCTFVAEQSYNTKSPQRAWFTDQPFLPGLIPLESDSTYRIDQVKFSQNNVLEAMFKHYWTINNDNHLYTTVGPSPPFQVIERPSGSYCQTATATNLTMRVSGTILRIVWSTPMRSPNTNSGSANGSTSSDWPSIGMI